MTACVFLVAKQELMCVLRGIKKEQSILERGTRGTATEQIYPREGYQGHTEACIPEGIQGGHRRNKPYWTRAQRSNKN